MARISDTERGARIALDVSRQYYAQPDLFGAALGEEFWLAIYAASVDQLCECAAYRESVQS